MFSPDLAFSFLGPLPGQSQPRSRRPLQATFPSVDAPREAPGKTLQLFVLQTSCQLGFTFTLPKGRSTRSVCPVAATGESGTASRLSPWKTGLRGRRRGVTPRSCWGLLFDLGKFEGILLGKGRSGEAGKMEAPPARPHPPAPGPQAPVALWRTASAPGELRAPAASRSRPLGARRGWRRAVSSPGECSVPPHPDPHPGPCSRSRPPCPRRCGQGWRARGGRGGEGGRAPGTLGRPGADGGGGGPAGRGSLAAALPRGRPAVSGRQKSVLLSRAVGVVLNGGSLIFP